MMIPFWSFLSKYTCFSQEIQEKRLQLHGKTEKESISLLINFPLMLK